MSIDITDRGLTLGDGLFETLLAVDGALEDEAAHLDRLERGCRQLGLPLPDRRLAQAVMAEALAKAGSGRISVRLTYTAGPGGRGLDRPPLPSPRLFALAAPAPLWTQPARLITAGVRRNEGSPASRLKTLNYLDNVLARREATLAGADEAVMLNNAGHVAGVAAGNLFWFEDEVLCTPSPACGALEGIMRARVIAAALDNRVRVHEDRFSTAALAEGRDHFLTNALIGLRPVTLLDGRPVDQGVGAGMWSLLRGRR